MDGHGQAITISLTNNLYLAMSYVSDTHGMSLSHMVRKALQEADVELLTKRNANLIGGGHYRTVVNITSNETRLLDGYCRISELSKSAVIRAAVGRYLVKFAASN